MFLNKRLNAKFGLPVKTETGTAGGQPVRDRLVPGGVNSIGTEVAKPSLPLFTMLGKMPQKTQRSIVFNLIEF